MVIGTELNYINKWLTKLDQLQRLSIFDIHLFIYLITELVVQFTQKMGFKLKIWIKNVEESNQYYAIDGFIKKIFVLCNWWIS